jgi:hypothetical protein
MKLLRSHRDCLHAGIVDRDLLQASGRTRSLPRRNCIVMMGDSEYYDAKAR